MFIKCFFNQGFKIIFFFSGTGKDSFIVMLFNDESHTYDEVIETLQAAVPNCRKNHAIHFATIVDKMVYFKHVPFHFCFPFFYTYLKMQLNLYNTFV